ncbi:disease resistance protein At4g27190-like isoform X2 [Carya illinoinensis]|uniref:Uncharacterized protein n=1 Tax=Carya illinoinensis TaxID=32201 RepID=A0A8T1RHT4_CARIL|nr:disease resistance protein At4g27190-like isoform X2 [Carya illinoinensis]KAG6666587.1 hypothetical protein CIPAW_01G041600 [Carya illinoinensis]
MEVVASIISGAVVETTRLLCGSIYSTIKNIVKGPLPLHVLEKEMKFLMALRDDATKEMALDKREGKVIKAQAILWVGEVEDLHRKVNDQIQEAKSSRCFLSCSTKRYRMSRKVAKQLKEVKRLLEVGSSLASSVALSHPEFKAVEHIPGSSIQDQTTSISEDLAKTMTLVSDDKYGIIGIWGMGGVGKTYLVRNLNNELQNNSNLRFSCVLWVTVSKNLDIKMVQMRIASRLHLNLEESSGADGMAIQLYQRLKEESFLLILDDVWEKIDLDKLGVPRPEEHRGSKIILTCRSLDVCRDMVTDVEVKMMVLRDEDAWQLFSRYARDVVTSEHIRPLAEAICRECHGLPLAIVTMGAAMRGKTKPELWNHALNQLRRSVPYAAGIEEKLYKPLKWSYDSLEVEGLIDERENYEDFFSRGIALIENLKDSCLLEDGSGEGTVKMHDVVRDVSIWIASTCSEDGSEFLVRSGNGLKEISATELSNSLRRVSFMNNDLERLPDDSVIQCSEASTLLLQGNRRLDRVPARFLEGFGALRLLNISGTRIKSFPDSLLQLDNIRALLLSNCQDLEELPPLERLSRLQVLDLSLTGIRELPRGLEQLSNLRHLNLGKTRRLKVVQAGVISKLSSLEVLDLSNSCYIWKVKGAVQEKQACFEELQCLERLQVLSIRLILCYSPQDTIISWINRLKAFEVDIEWGYSHLVFQEYRRSKYINCSSLYSQYLQVPSLSPLSGAQRCVIMEGTYLSGGQVGCWLSKASYLCLSSCRGLNKMLQDLIINSVGSFSYLKKLVFCDSDCSFRTGGRAAEYDLLPNLEELCLILMTCIESISELANHLGLRFQRLKTIDVISCGEMKYLLSLGNSIRTMPNLEVIWVHNCSNLEELFNYLPLQNMTNPDPITPNLRKLELNDLPNLRSLCSDEKTWPGIDQVEVINCNLFETLSKNKMGLNELGERIGAACKQN